MEQTKLQCHVINLSDPCVNTVVKNKFSRLRTDVGKKTF